MNPRRFYSAALLVCAGTLAAVLLMEYGFGLKPCELCTLQRIPYAVGIALSGLALALGTQHRLFLGLLALTFFAGAALGVYHAGVEKHLFPGPTACTSEPLPADTTEEALRERILNAPVVACDQPQWQWNGITLAMLNAMWALAWCGFFAWGWRRHYAAR